MSEKVEATPAPKSPRAAALKAELLAEEARLEALLAPARELHDRHANDPAYLEAKRVIKSINPQLAAVKNELAALVRAGGSKGLMLEAGEYRNG